jgi:hypothetical protein
MVWRMHQAVKLFCTSVDIHCTTYTPFKALTSSNPAESTQAPNTTFRIPRCRNYAPDLQITFKVGPLNDVLYSSAMGVQYSQLVVWPTKPFEVEAGNCPDWTKVNYNVVNLSSANPLQALCCSQTLDYPVSIERPF